MGQHYTALVKRSACFSSKSHSNSYEDDGGFRMNVDTDYRLFLSYANVDHTSVAATNEALRSYGLRCFMAGQSLKPTDDWLEEVQTQLKRCCALIAFLSPAFRNSEWTDQEVGQCLGQGKPVLSIQLHRKVSPHGFLARYQALNAEGMAPQALADALLAALTTLPSERSRLGASLIDLIGQIRDPQQVEKIGATIGHCGVHDARQSATLLTALRSNPVLNRAACAGVLTSLCLESSASDNEMAV
jgi:TIR domain